MLTEPLEELRVSMVVQDSFLIECSSSVISVLGVILVVEVIEEFLTR